MPERASVVGERRDVRAPRAFADGPLQLSAAAVGIAEGQVRGRDQPGAVGAELADPAVVGAGVGLRQLGVVELGLPQQADRRVEDGGVDALGVEQLEALSGPCCRTALRSGRCGRGRAASPAGRDRPSRRASTGSPAGSSSRACRRSRAPRGRRRRSRSAAPGRGTSARGRSPTGRAVRGCGRRRRPRRRRTAAASRASAWPSFHSSPNGHRTTPAQGRATTTPIRECRPPRWT